MSAGEGSDGLAVRLLEPLARHTPLRTGGPCDAWVVVHRPDALPRVVSDCRAVGWKWRLLGAGTRLVFRDGPIDGVVMRLGTGFGAIERLGETTWRVGAAVPVPALLAWLAREGHTGLEGLGSVAGTVGASAVWDGDWSDFVEEVEALHRDKLRPMSLSDVAGRDGRVVTSVTVTLRSGSPEKAGKALGKALKKGRPGAWYRLPGRGELRQVLQSAQLPLVRLRQVAIPDAAPELLVNLGEGRAADLALLHRSATDRVKKVRGIELESTLKWVGTEDAS